MFHSLVRLFAKSEVLSRSKKMTIKTITAAVSKKRNTETLTQVTSNP